MQLQDGVIAVEGAGPEHGQKRSDVTAAIVVFMNEHVVRADHRLLRSALRSGGTVTWTGVPTGSSARQARISLISSG